MKKFKKALIVILLLFTLSACKKDTKTTYEILINDEITTEFYIGDYINYKDFFIIRDNNGNTIPVEDTMIDTSKVNINQAGNYEIIINYKGLEEKVTIIINQKVTCIIETNETKSTSIILGDEDVDFKDYFIIKDSIGNIIPIQDSMIDSSNVNINKVGSYIIKINYQGIIKEITINVIQEKITYVIIINESKPTSIILGDEDVDFKDYFIIKDSIGNIIPTEDSMIDSSMVNINIAGSYIVKANYQGITKEIIVNVIQEKITYVITVNESKSTSVMMYEKDINFKEYFIIKDSKGNDIEVLDSMLDLSEVNLKKVGSFTITLTYEDYLKSLEIFVTEPDKMYSSDIFISEYSEGSSYNKYIEIFNGTGHDVDLTNYTLKLFNNSEQVAQYELALSGILKDGEILVVYNQGANTTIKNNGDLSNQVISFNGNDPIALFKDGVLIDVVGDLNKKVSDGFDVGVIKNATKDNTIIRKSNVFCPNSVWTNDEWEVLGFEVYSNIKKHEMDYYQKPEIPGPIERIPDLFISEYFEGSGAYSNSKYIEIYNGLGYDVDLSAYAIRLYSNGQLEPTFTQLLSGILKDGEVYIIYSPNSSSEIKNAGHLSSLVVNFTGKEAIALTKNDKIIDLFGIIGDNPTGDGWIIDNINTTANNTLIRNKQVNSPTALWITSEWDLYYENYLFDLGKHNKEIDNLVIEDFDILFNLIKNLKLNDKGTAQSEKTITIRGTLFMDVKNETTLVYITDGKNFIKLHGEKIHNYTSPNQVYEVIGYYKANLYQPTFEVISPSTDIKVIKNATPVTNILYKDVTLEEILNLKKENFVENINNGYLQSMLHVKAYLQLDTHNSNTWDYALTVNETYIKNDTQYIKNGLYFKNDVEELDDFLIDYEVDLDHENVKVDIFGVIYDWNPNRKNWRIYVSDTLTFDYLTK